VVQSLLLRKRNRDTDEMNRQLWLCDKLLIHVQAEGKDQQMALQEYVKNMNVFFALRQKHFGIESQADRNILASYLNQSDTVNIQTKLKEYKAWVAQEQYQ
jgi:predicted secreted protein